MMKKRFIKIIYILIVITVVTLLFINDNGVGKYFSLKTEIKDLNGKIETTKTQINKLNLEIDSLQNSDVKIEQVARDKYRMKFKDEVPVKINKQ